MPSKKTKKDPTYKVSLSVPEDNLPNELMLTFLQDISSSLPSDSKMPESAIRAAAKQFIKRAQIFNDELAKAVKEANE